MGTAPHIPRLRIAVLGIITIAVYGSWYYAFGVLLDPIIADTGWTETALTAAFSASGLVSGIGAVVGGWLLDRYGSRFVFGLAAAITLAAFSIATTTESIGLFALTVAVGGGSLGALGFYHVTQTAAVRISPGDTTRAIAVLTIWGAFASAVYLPLSAWLVQVIDWRVTLRVITFSAVAALTLGAVLIDTRVRGTARSRLVLKEMREALRGSAARRFVAAQALAGISVSILLVYQVPAMTAAGLTLSAASFWAGFRGFAQLGGRLPLMPIVTRLGPAGSLRLSYTAIAVGMGLLTVAGNHVIAAVFALVAGFGIGASSPLVGMHARDVFGAASLGTSMGFVSLVFLVVGSLGPVGAGWIATVTGSRALPVLLGAAIVLLAAALLSSQRQ